MIELVFVACFGITQQAPGVCEQRRLLYTEVTPLECVMGAEPELARWVETHPNWTIARWTCRYLDTTRRDA
ncbi:hypothetical protein [Rhodovulum euryhalinum]|uniref:Uncharacterized protein n=1 Tax=Rhodovulum euryhalinum TaxID=35805 RepID=A0A4R2KYC6_9RHOB|nr:hypothetical protein [Rhodovulum euryhalinum]TCO71685.1 hypothetical protein EV655_106178 [Rhodovulum euryhalinum]